jgi:hypothetical protein
MVKTGPGQAMREYVDWLADDEAITLTTETPAGIASYAGIVAFCGGLAALMNAMGYCSSPLWDFERIWALVAFDAFFVLMPLLLVFVVPRGTWIIDNQGIVFHPCHRSPGVLRWSEVERVLWSAGVSSFRSRHTTIQIPSRRIKQIHPAWPWRLRLKKEALGELS